MEPFKNIFNINSIKKYSTNIRLVYAQFNHQSFEKNILGELDSLELKDRVRLIAKELNNHLPSNYKKAIDILIKTLIHEKDHLAKEWEGLSHDKVNGFLVWPYTQFVEDFGQGDFNTSLKAMYEFTKRFTSEFVIRSYINNYPDEMYKTLGKWQKDKNYHVRRLVSEGTRPNLPWGNKIINLDLEKNIKLILPLVNDPDEYVRRSVANHLNDISRINPDLFLKTITPLVKGNKEQQKLARHAARSLFKQGHKKTLILFGYKPTTQLKTDIKVTPKLISEGDSLIFKIKLSNLKNTMQKIMLDYSIHYPKKNGSLSPKVFKLKDINFKAGESLNFEKKHHFKKVTTRVHYPGTHIIEFMINGEIVYSTKFKLKG